MPNLNPDDIITISIHSFGESGEGVGDHEGYRIYVDGVLPGEIATVRLSSCHKTYAHATLLDIQSPSKYRVQPVCKHFGVCGGCQIMHLDYSQQLLLKQSKVVHALQKWENVKSLSVSSCIKSPKELNYRNKTQLPARQGIGERGLEEVRLGLYARSSHDLVEIERCFIHSDLGEQVYKEVRKVIKDSHLTAYDAQSGQEKLCQEQLCHAQLYRGYLRHVLIKSSESFSEALVILVTTCQESESLISLGHRIMQSSPYIKGVVHNMNRTDGNVVLGDKYEILAGTGHIHQRLGDLTFTLSPASFFQVNSGQAECLYTKAIEFAGLCGDETVLDAYCGVGTISLFFAKHVQRIIGVECIPQAIENARENAKLNGILNAEFICAHAEDYVSNLNSIDVVILNPPRKGCERRFLDGIRRLNPSRIVYISCNPVSLARDLSYLVDLGYNVQAIQPYDMFPQTAHVECVVQLKRS